MIILTAQSLTLSFGAQQVLSDITFAAGAGERVGVVGVNGVGKTSLFRLLAGEVLPDSGTVSLSRGVRVGLLHQQTDLTGEGELTLLEYMLTAFPHLQALEAELHSLEQQLTALSHTPADTDLPPSALAVQLAGRYEQCSRRYAESGGLSYRSRCLDMLARLGFGGRAADKIACLSGGQHTRLALARLLTQEPELLLLDEPTNHLDLEAVSWLEQHLSAYPGTLLLVSHDRYFLDAVTTRTLQLDHGRAALYKGNYSQAKQQQQTEEAGRLHRLKEQQKIRARIEANIEFQRRCGQAHNFVTIRSKQKQLDRMETIELAPKSKTIKFRFAAQRESAGDVLWAEDLCFSYGGGPLLEHLHFLVRRGERVLVLGPNGCGKSTLMKLVCGELRPLSGHIETGYNITIGYYDQEMRGLDLQKTVFEQLHDAHPDRTVGEIRTTLAQFLFFADDIDKPIRTLSGGERARVLLAGLMLQKVNLLVMDEPTNHLDIDAREALESALEAFEGTILAVSHDRYFIDRIATRLIELDRTAPGGCVDYLTDNEEGAFTAYLRHRAAAAPTEPGGEPPTPAAKTEYLRRKKDLADKKSEQRKRERAKEKAVQIETELEALQQELFEQTGADYVRAAEIEARRASLEAELWELYELYLD
ncbi:MAG: ATP-binding cassette domain-containing protein [Eubacteriales bacterium]